MKTQSVNINTNHEFLQYSRTCGNPDCRFSSCPNPRLMCSSCCFENGEITRSKRACNPSKTYHEQKIVSQREKTSPRALQDASRMPPCRLKTPPGRVQDASRTVPRRLRIVSKARLLLISLSGPQNYPQTASKNTPRCSQNAPSIQTDRDTETQTDIQINS